MTGFGFGFGPPLTEEQRKIQVIPADENLALCARVEELQAENAKLRKALRPLAKWPVLTGADFFRLMPEEIREAQIAPGEE